MRTWVVPVALALMGGAIIVQIVDGGRQRSELEALRASLPAPTGAAEVNREHTWLFMSTSCTSPSTTRNFACRRDAAAAVTQISASVERPTKSTPSLGSGHRRDEDPSITRR
ncbi:hypothetical protein WME76_22235 [Sorangium sp. So ce119]